MTDPHKKPPPTTLTKTDPLLSQYTVTLDGEEQQDVTFASTTSGIVRRYQRTKLGALIQVRGILKQVTLYGSVEFKCK